MEGLIHVTLTLALNVYFGIEGFEARIQTINIGALLSSESAGQIFSDAVNDINNRQLLGSSIYFNATSFVLTNSPLEVSRHMCDHVIPTEVSTVIVSHSNLSQSPPLAVSYTCGFYSIPVVGISARDGVFSDKNIHPSFLRTVAPYSDQAAIWIDILIHFKWTSIVVLHSSDFDGRNIFSQIQNEILKKTQPIQIDKEVSFKPGKDSYISDLSKLVDVESRVVLFYASAEDAKVIYKEANLLNLTTSGYVWIVTEQALSPHNVPTGTLGLCMVGGDNETSQIIDAVDVISRALQSVYSDKKQIITQVPKACESSDKIWTSGQTVYRYLKETELKEGLSGPVKFNNVGDRLMASYELINIQDTKQLLVGSYDINKVEEDRLTIKDSSILWMGRQVVKPKGIKILTHLKVVTIKQMPFVLTRPIADDEKCNQDPKVFEVECHKADNTTKKGFVPYCCYGYCMEMLKKLSFYVNFTYNVHLVGDGSFGAFEKPNNATDRRWNGMIGELLSYKADLIVAPLTITPDRAKYIDFSKPFKYQGLTILVKRKPQSSNLGSFLQPFQMTLWLLVVLSVHVVAVVLYLLDRFSPFGQFKLAKSDDTEEDALNLSTAIWFAWGVLLNSGIGEGTPRSFSARVLGMVWAGFAMIIVASYTANLAAFLVLDRPDSAISGIDDARMRNPVDDYKYATVKDSAVETYFRSRVELSTMYRTMGKWGNFEKTTDGIKAVKDGTYKAFIWDSSRLEYEAAQDCELKTVEGLFGRSSLGIGMRRKSPWKDPMSLTILNFHENGTMESLDNKWILNNAVSCPVKGSSPATLGLTNMAGVFMMVAGGIVIGVILVFVEIAYKNHHGMKEKEQEIARLAAHRWRSNIERRKFRRRMLLDLSAGEKLSTAGSVSDVEPSRNTMNHRLNNHRLDPNPNTSSGYV